MRRAVGIFVEWLRSPSGIPKPATSPNKKLWNRADGTAAYAKFLSILDAELRPIAMRSRRFALFHAFTRAFGRPEVYTAASSAATDAAVVSANEVMIRAVRARLSVEMKLERKVNGSVLYRAERNERDNTYSLQWA